MTMKKLECFKQTPNISVFYQQSFLNRFESNFSTSMAWSIECACYREISGHLDYRLCITVTLDMLSTHGGRAV